MFKFVLLQISTTMWGKVLHKFQ